MDFSRRSALTELMDTEVVTEADFAACLADLAVVNRVTVTHRPTLAWLDRVTKRIEPGTAISVLDVGSGHGDLLRAVRRWAVGRGIAARLEGIDLSAQSTAAAIAATPAGAAIAFRTGDVLAYAPDPAPDFIVSSQVAHHFSDDGLVSLLRWFDRTARRGWLIVDLHRHPVPYHVFRALAAAARWHRFVRHDGPVSIARSFKRADWQRLLDQAGVRATIRWNLPFRWTVGRDMAGGDP